VAEIIFGWLMEPGNVAKITSCAERLKMSPRYYFSSPSFDQQKFVNIPKMVVPCEYCDGYGFRSEDR
jgi:hypothetical protein